MDYKNLKGGVNISVIINGFLNKYYNFYSIGELRMQLELEYPNSDIELIYGGKTKKDDSYILLEGSQIHVWTTPILKPKKVIENLLDKKKSDFSKINRSYLKFASCPTGGHNTKFYRVSFKKFTEEEKLEFFNLLKDHFGFEINIVDTSTFYDKEAVELTLKLFHDKGILTKFKSISDLYLTGPKETKKYFMKFIHIIFGEIEDIPGGPQPLFKNKGEVYDHQSENFKDLEPMYQEIIITLRNMYAPEKLTIIPDSPEHEILKAIIMNKKKEYLSTFDINHKIRLLSKLSYCHNTFSLPLNEHTELIQNIKIDL